MKKREEPIVKGPHLFLNKKNLIPFWCMLLYIYIYIYIYAIYAIYKSIHQTLNPLQTLLEVSSFYIPEEETQTAMGSPSSQKI
jgi:hypothetical protein